MKKNMKKWICLFVSVVMLLALPACGSAKTEPAAKIGHLYIQLEV